MGLRSQLDISTLFSLAISGYAFTTSSYTGKTIHKKNISDFVSHLPSASGAHDNLDAQKAFSMVPQTSYSLFKAPANLKETFHHFNLIMSAIISFAKVVDTN